MSAWVTKEWTDDRGKIRREKSQPGMRGVGDRDCFVVEWIAPNGKRRRKKISGVGRVAKRVADEKRDQVAASITLGEYQDSAKATWSTFVARFRKEVVEVAGHHTADLYRIAIASFERIASPMSMAAIDSGLLGTFISARRKEFGKKDGVPISPATLNRDLRHLRAMLRWAVERKYLREMPKITFAKCLGKLPRVLSEAEFVAIYNACEEAQRPVIQGVSAADWWRALIVTLFTTGWRIGETLALEWHDINLDTGTVHLRAETTKGRRDEILTLPPIVIEHLAKIRHFGERVFDFDVFIGDVGRKKPLYEEWYRLQAVAGIAEHHGFHSARRSFATWNHGRFSADELQRLMRHKSYSTTRSYVSLAEKMTGASANVFVPSLPVRAASS
jgi:integrase